METTELDRDPPQESAEPNPQVACHQHGTVGGTAVILGDIVYRQKGKNGEGKALSSRPEARLLTVMDRAATTIKKLGLA